MTNITQSYYLLARKHLLDQVAREGLFTDGLFSQSQPELTGLQSHVLVWVLGPLQHVLVKKTTRCDEKEAKSQSQAFKTTFLIESHPHLDDAVHMWDETVNADFQQHDKSPAHVLSHFTVLVTSQCKQALVRKRGEERRRTGGREESVTGRIKKHRGSQKRLATS